MAVTKKSPAKKVVAAKKPAAKKAAVSNTARYGAVPKFPSPGHLSIKYLRESVPGLLQQHAATLVKSNLSTYGKWETGIVPMHPGLWELMQTKVAKLVAGEIPHPAGEIALAAKKAARK